MVWIPSFRITGMCTLVCSIYTHHATDEVAKIIQINVMCDDFFSQSKLRFPKLRRFRKKVYFIMLELVNRLAIKHMKNVIFPLKTPYQLNGTCDNFLAAAVQLWSTV